MPHTDHAPSPATKEPDGNLAGLSARLAEAREELQAEAERACAGVRTLRRYSSRIDGILKDIHGVAAEKTQKPTALIPLGGYGRRHLCQYSDIDLLIVVDGTIGAPEERFLRGILHPLWDLGLEVGHQVRQLAEFAEPETDNPEYLAALLDARFLVGDRSVFDRSVKACRAADSPWREPMRAALIDLARQRHGQFNHTVFQLEPDIKEAPGGLRDATAIRLLARMTRGTPGEPYMDVGRLDEAEDFMLRVRSILHMKRGHNVNILAHGMQETVAQHFGSPGEQKRRQVELMMSTYYHHARRIDRSMATVLKSSLAPPDRNEAVTRIGDDLELAWDGVRFLDGTLASLQPHGWLRPFEAALDQDVDVSEQVLTCIERHGERYAPESFFPGEEERDRFLRVLRPRPGLYARLSDMHGRGLLGRMFPEFQKVYCLVVRDFYHKYTVDEHTLRTIRNVEHLCTPRTDSRKRFAGILDELEQPELLVLALLFHDVGKWTNKNHSEEGVRMASGALRRIRLPEKAIATVEFLIRHHLQMSVLAFRRDVEDPETATRFARLVGTEERLKLLCLLTLADVDAVSPGVMTPWKEEMLWRLYVDSYNRLTLGYSDDAIEDAQAVRDELSSERPANVSQADLDAFVEGLPQRYLRVVDRPRVYEHVRLARGLQPKEVRSLLEQQDAAWELSTLALDQPGLFANVCGVLSYFGMDILRGQAMTNRHGLVIDIFQFADQEGYLRLNQVARDELTALLEDVVSGRVDIADKLRGRWGSRSTSSPPQQTRPTVRFNNHYSRRFTVLEVVAANAWGLLYRLSHTLSAHGCDIDLVLISTEGTLAIDVFHVTKDRAKLPDADQQALKDELLQTLAANP
jgi:[protein-PII] uridylyltransferase